MFAHNCGILISIVFLNEKYQGPYSRLRKGAATSDKSENYDISQNVPFKSRLDPDKVKAFTKHLSR